MKKILNEGWQLFKRNWLQLIIFSILMTTIIIDFAQLVPDLVNYDAIHQQYLDNELWEYWVAAKGFNIILLITWTICLYKGIWVKILKKEIALKKQKENNNG